MKTKIILLIILIFSGFALFAQEGRNRKQNTGNEGRWNKIEEYKKLKMLEELKLSEEESLKFYTRYINFRNQIKDLEKERRSLMGDLESALNSSSNQSELPKRIESLENNDQKIFDSRKSFFSDIKKILPPEKCAKYIIFERNFMHEIQNIMKDLRKERGK